MTLNTQLEFSEIYSKLKKESHSLEDISNLITLVRYNRKNMSIESQKTLLQIPLAVLENHVELKNTTIWISQNGSYFASNYNLEPFHSKFSTNDFDLSTIIDCLKETLSCFETHTTDFTLRIPEVTLRDNVVLKEFSTFKASGLLFALIMEKAFSC